MIETLFQPASINGIQLKNRFVRSATAEGMATFDGYPTQKVKDMYCKLAENEIGLIITSGACVEAWKNYPETLGFISLFAVYDDRCIEAWQSITDAVHERGAKIAMQIGHLGRQDIPELRGSEPIAPSPIPIKGSDVVPREMTKGDIHEVSEKFAQACRRVKEAGFDAVQFHGAHGNLINNFMSPFTNIRTDDYGGSVKNRARFMVDIIEKARKLVGPGYPLILKMNFNDYVDDGLDMDSALRIAEILEQAGIDCIEVSGGMLSDSREHIAVKGIHKKEQEAYFEEYAKALKDAVDIPVILVGGHRTPDVVERIVKEGAADFISMSRPLIREPELVRRWKHGNLETATCVSCNQCFENWLFRPIRCYVDEPLEEKQKP